MPLSSTARRRDKRRFPISVGLKNANHNNPDYQWNYGANNHHDNANSDLPWYCSGSNLNGNMPNFAQTYTANRGNRRTPPIIIYRDMHDRRPNNITALFANSSVPGLREICNSDQWIRKIGWFFVFALLGYLALKDIHQLLSEFYHYPVSVDVRIRESRKLPFPAVTVCNLNIVRYSALCNSTLNIEMPPEVHEKLCGTASVLNLVSVQVGLFLFDPTR